MTSIRHTDATAPAPNPAPAPAVHDLVVTGGRVVDPANGVDDLVDVGITDGVVTELGTGLAGRGTVSAAGCVVAPGFIDLHSHAHGLEGHRLQACDGVTTALDLESGVLPVESAYHLAGSEGRPLNYGYSAAWASARMQTLGQISPDGTIATMFAHIGDPSWQQPANLQEIDRISAALGRELDAGALGIGVLVGYAQSADPGEYLAIAGLAAERGVPTYTHARDLIEITPQVLIDGAEEIVRAAAQTGAHMHYCHVNSTSFRHLDRVLQTVERVRAEGSRVTTEAYPYGAGMTGIGAEFLAPERLAARGLTPMSLTYAPTGERVADDRQLRELRDRDPGALVIIDFLDEANAEDHDTLMRALTFPDACIASDAMPLTWQGPPRPEEWPLPPTAFTHPRTAGTFARAFHDLVVEHRLLSVSEFVMRASTLPARIVATASSSARRKGHLGVGADADIVVFDPADYRDQATYAAPTRPSRGIRHLLVNGTPVVRDGDLILDARPGRPVRA